MGYATLPEINDCLFYNIFAVLVRLLNLAIRVRVLLKMSALPATTNNNPMLNDKSTLKVLMPHGILSVPDVIVI
jgi:hypothetical protein